jgi:hypothetical protein
MKQPDSECQFLKRLCHRRARFRTLSYSATNDDGQVLGSYSSIPRPRTAATSHVRSYAPRRIKIGYPRPRKRLSGTNSKTSDSKDYCREHRAARTSPREFLIELISAHTSPAGGLTSKSPVAPQAKLPSEPFKARANSSGLLQLRHQLRFDRRCWMVGLGWPHTWGQDTPRSPAPQLFKPLFGPFSVLDGLLHHQPPPVPRTCAAPLSDLQYSVPTQELFDEAERFTGGNIDRVAAFSCIPYKLPKQVAIGDTKKGIDSSCAFNAVFSERNTIRMKKHTCNTNVTFLHTPADD